MYMLVLSIIEYQLCFNLEKSFIKQNVMFAPRVLIINYSGNSTLTLNCMYYSFYSINYRC